MEREDGKLKTEAQYFELGGMPRYARWVKFIGVFFWLMYVASVIVI